MSGGTLIALAADEIVLAPSAVLGPIDPQLGQHPAASILAAVDRKDVNKVDDETLIMADVARKAISQVREAATVLLTRRGMDSEEADKLAGLLSEGTWTHDHPITAEAAMSLGLRVSTEIPQQVRDLIRLYPQPRGRRPAVEYIPLPYRAPARSTEPEGR
jgi:ClpP class serine protease